MKLLKIDEQGYFIEDVIVKEIPMILVSAEDGSLDGYFIEDPQYIQIPCECGFYKPKWDGNKWVEGLKQTEIDEIVNAPKSKTELEKMQEAIDFLLMNGGM